MLDSFEDFKSAILVSLKDKVSKRIADERYQVSNNLFRAMVKQEAEESPEETQSNAEEN